MSLPNIPPITWLMLTVEAFGHWSWQQRRFLPEPLTASAAGRWEPAVEEALGLTPPPDAHRGGGEQRLLDTLAQVLAAPAYSAYVIRSAGATETHYAAVVRGDHAIALIIDADTVRIGQVPATMIATVLANEAPAVRPAPTVRMEVPPQTAQLLAAGVTRNAPAASVRGAMVAAGIPVALAERVLADQKDVRAVGTVGAMRYTPDAAVITARCSSWTEMPDGGMISSVNRAGDVVWEPFTAAALARTVAEALSGLAT